MPRAKDDAVPAPAADTETGFAALEAKVEEVQVEAAIEAELAVEDDALAAAPVPNRVGLEAVVRTGSQTRAQGATEALGGQARPAYASPDLVAPLSGMLDSMAGWAQSAARLQVDTLASFAAVRSPQDLLKAQLAYGERVVELYFSTLAGVGRKRPQPAGRIPS